MKIKTKIFMSMIVFALSATSLTALAQNVCDIDNDGDRYFQDDGCDQPTFAKGLEHPACDGADGEGDFPKGFIDCTGAETEDGNQICDSNRYPNGVDGSRVKPGAFEVAGDGLDQDCNFQEEELVPGGNTGAGLLSMIDTVIGILSKIVIGVSAAALIWGGIMFATAAGNDEKIHKAKKTMLGAVIGLIVGLSAWLIVGFVVSNFGS
jgi:hypothetical protein